LKKIIIITYIFSYNYGAFLQAKATQLMLEKLGFSSIFLDYCSNGEKKQRSIIKWYKSQTVKNNLKNILGSLYFGIIKKEITNGKSNFGKAIADLPKISMLALNAETVLCGSDQIWNPDICDGKFDPIYFGDVIGAQKKVSFASSFGSYRLLAGEEVIIKRYLSGFSSISVREEYAKKMLKSFLKNDIEVVLDPTLCVDKTGWLKLSKNREKYREVVKEKYILLYTVGDYRVAEKFIKYYKKKLECKVLWLKLDTRQNLDVDYIINDATPYDFLYLISEADFIITNSFHGTVFSINFNIDFISIKNQKNPERVKDILEKLNLESRLVDSSYTTSQMPCKCIDYSKSNMLLQNLREESLNWIFNALKNEKNNQKYAD